MNVFMYDESSDVTGEQVGTLRSMVKRLQMKEQDVFDNMTEKVLNLYGYPNNLEIFYQPFFRGSTEGFRKGFYKSSISKSLDESNVICYIYTYRKNTEYVIEEYWNV